MHLWRAARTGLVVLAIAGGALAGGGPRNVLVIVNEASEESLEIGHHYLRARGISQEDAIGAIVNGFCKDVLDVLPLEFAAEAQKLLALKLENSVG
jgi:hypothetical protein